MVQQNTSSSHRKKEIYMSSYLIEFLVQSLHYSEYWIQLIMSELNTINDERYIYRLCLQCLRHLMPTCTTYMMHYSAFTEIKLSISEFVLINATLLLSCQYL